MRNLFVIIVLIFILPSFDIVRRHDKSDQEYLELGKSFDAVCKVGKDGGDGTLVAADWVVTAAHVAEGMMRRSGGTIELFLDGDIERTSAQVFIHPEFDGPNGHDIALIRLNEPVTTIQPLPFYKQKDEKNQLIYIVGHGDYKHGNSTEWKRDGNRRAATNTIDDVKELFILFDFDKPGSDATELEGTAGPGDSGGPAIIRIGGIDYIAGISSAAMPGENGPGTYGAKEFYTRVSTKIDWLENVLEGKVAPQTRKRVVSRSGISGPKGLFEELGLIFNDENGSLMIVGKIDEIVPEDLNAVQFKHVSTLKALNGKVVNSISELRSAFDAVKAGESFTLEFSIQEVKKEVTLRK